MRLIVVLGLFLGASLAGCLGGGSSGPAGVDSEVLFDDETGAIRGHVTSDSLEPLNGAVVHLTDSGQNATTNEAGEFQISQVAPGAVGLEVAKLGYESVAREVQVEVGRVTETSFQLPPLPIEEPYHATEIQEGLIGCGLLLKRDEDPNASHNFIAACGVFGNLGYYAIDQFHLVWAMGDLYNTSGAWGETSWTSTQAAGKGMSAIWSVLDSSNTAGGIHAIRRGNSVQSPLGISFTSEEILDVLEAKDTIQDCTESDCNIHAFHYGRAETLGTPVDVGVALQQRYTEYFTLFYNQDVPDVFSAVPDE